MHHHIRNWRKENWKNSLFQESTYFSLLTMKWPIIILSNSNDFQLSTVQMWKITDVQVFKTSVFLWLTLWLVFQEVGLNLSLKLTGLIWRIRYILTEVICQKLTGFGGEENAKHVLLRTNLPICGVTCDKWTIILLHHFTY